MSIAGVAYLQRLHLWHEQVEELVVYSILDDHAGSGHADLALMNKHSKSGRIHRIFEVGILHHQQRTLAAHFEVELFAATRALHANQAADGSGTGKQDRFDA